jgi:hypothetical protein
MWQSLIAFGSSRDITRNFGALRSPAVNMAKMLSIAVSLVRLFECRFFPSCGSAILTYAPKQLQKIE